MKVREEMIVQSREQIRTSIDNWLKRSYELIMEAENNRRSGDLFLEKGILNQIKKLR